LDGLDLKQLELLVEHLEAFMREFLAEINLTSTRPFGRYLAVWNPDFFQHKAAFPESITLQYAFDCFQIANKALKRRLGQPQ